MAIKARKTGWSKTLSTITVSVRDPDTNWMTIQMVWGIRINKRNPDPAKENKNEEKVKKTFF